MTFVHKIKDFLGLKRDIVLLLVIIIFVGLGEKSWERFAPKYLEGLGGSVLIIGGLGFLQNILGAFWSLPGGYIADSLGNKKAFYVFNFLAIFGYVIAILFTNWTAVFIGMIFFSAWNAISLPASMSLITKALDNKKTAMGISMHSIIRRVPMILGPVLGGFLITQYGLILGIKLCFGLSILLCILSMFILQKMTPSANINNQKINPLSLWKKFDKRLKYLLVSDILIRFCEQIPYVFVVIWCINFVKVSPQQFGYLSAIEMITAALLYIPVASFSDRLERKPFVVITFIFFAIFPLVLYLSNSFIFLIAAFIVRGLKEFGEPTRKALIIDLSVKDAAARTFGLYYFIRDTVVSLAAFGGGFLWSLGPFYNFLAATIFGIIGTLYFLIFGKGTEKTV